jgi:UDP-N-acetylglucosamine:LPS N-acetylglucosamine transferase
METVKKMEKNIGIVSLQSGGTRGHMTLTTNLARSLFGKRKIFVLSEDKYSAHSNVPNNLINFLKIKKQIHQNSVGGCITYKHNKNLLEMITKHNISTLIFSTFYDLDLLAEARAKGIKCILISYPLRDSHRKAILTRKYYSYFDKIFVLKDLAEPSFIFPNEETVSPLKQKLASSNKIKKVRNVLITCGGGGRPSSEIFFTLIEKMISIISIEYPNIEFTIIKGLSKKTINLPQTKTIEWSTNFLKILKESDIVISEAGYFTLIDLISTNKLAILIPGARRIDNQELRACCFENLGLGYFLFPEEGTKKLVLLLRKMIENPKNTSKLYKNFGRVRKIIFSNKSLDKAILEEII